jgi:cytochrome c-type biogenesis protein CcmH
LRPRPLPILTLKPISLFIAILLVAAGCVAQDDVPPLERRAHDLNKTIMCPVCPGESIDQSQNTLAMQMRGIVQDKLAEGWTDDQIRDFFVERYGPSVLLEPPMSGFSLAAWIIPPVALAVAGTAFFFALRWMRRKPAGQPQAIEQNINMSDDELAVYYARIEAALGRTNGKVSSTEDSQSRGAG